MTDLGRPLRGNHATRAAPGAATASPPSGECQAQEGIFQPPANPIRNNIDALHAIDLIEGFVAGANGWREYVAELGHDPFDAIRYVFGRN